jgi:hypothetical protein
MEQNTEDEQNSIKELKITFTVNHIKVDSGKPPVTGTVDPCIESDNSEKMVLIWEGSEAEISITNQDGSAINDFKEYGPLAYFKQGVKYYYVNKKFIPDDINGLPEFVTYLNGKYSISNDVVGSERKYMEIVVNIVTQILSGQKPADASEGAIYDKLQQFKPTHDGFGNSFDDIEKCKAYITALNTLLGAGAAPADVPVGPQNPNPPANEEERARLAQEAERTRLAQEAERARLEQEEASDSPDTSPPESDDEDNNGRVPQGNNGVTPQQQQRAVEYRRAREAQKKLKEQRAQGNPEKRASFGAPSGAFRNTAQGFIPLSGPKVGQNSSQGVSSVFSGGNRTRRYQDKKNRQTRRYKFQ